jgi:hypothetical protein
LGTASCQLNEFAKMLHGAHDGFFVAFDRCRFAVNSRVAVSPDELKQVWQPGRGRRYRESAARGFHRRIARRGRSQKRSMVRARGRHAGDLEDLLDYLVAPVRSGGLREFAVRQELRIEVAFSDHALVGKRGNCVRIRPGKCRPR